MDHSEFLDQSDQLCLRGKRNQVEGNCFWGWLICPTDRLRRKPDLPGRGLEPSGYGGRICRLPEFCGRFARFSPSHLSPPGSPGECARCSGFFRSAISDLPLLPIRRQLGSGHPAVGFGQSVCTVGVNGARPNGGWGE